MRMGVAGLIQTRNELLRHLLHADGVLPPRFVEFDPLIPARAVSLMPEIKQQFREDGSGILAYVLHRAADTWVSRARHPPFGLVDRFLPVSTSPLDFSVKPSIGQEFQHFGTTDSDKDQQKVAFAQTMASAVHETLLRLASRAETRPTVAAYIGLNRLFTDAIPLPGGIANAPSLEEILHGNAADMAHYGTLQHAEGIRVTGDLEFPLVRVIRKVVERDAAVLGLHLPDDPQAKALVVGQIARNTTVLRRALGYSHNNIGVLALDALASDGPSSRPRANGRLRKYRDFDADTLQLVLRGAKGYSVNLRGLPL